MGSVILYTVIVVALTVGGEVVCLDDRVIIVCVKNCRYKNNKVLFYRFNLYRTTHNTRDVSLEDALKNNPGLANVSLVFPFLM